jgi:hypothetical protein
MGEQVTVSRFVCPLLGQGGEKRPQAVSGIMNGQAEQFLRLGVRYRPALPPRMKQRAD